METIYSLYLLLLCLNCGIGFVTGTIAADFAGDRGRNIPQIFEQPSYNTTTLEPDCDKYPKNDPVWASDGYCTVFHRLQTSGSSGIPSTTNGAATTINTNLTFGDWVNTITLLFNVLSIGHLLRMGTAFGFPGEFIIGLQAIFMFLMAVGIWFQLSGRGSKSSM